MIKATGRGWQAMAAAALGGWGVMTATGAAWAATEPTGFLRWAETPPMGWNSWDCFGTTVTEAQTRTQADVMAESLAQFGWEYIVVDIQWYEPNASGHNYRPGAALSMDPYGRLLPARNRFPSATDGAGFKPLADYVHAKGLKFGVHLMRGIPRQAVEANTPILGTDLHARDIADTQSTCAWNPDMFGVDMTRPGAQDYYNSVFRLFAEWGVDFVKVDDIARPYHEPELEAIRHAIDACGRPMVLSLSPGETPVSEGGHVGRHANMWRISDDFWDQWPALLSQFERCRQWAPFIGPGHWPDADMLPFGKIRMGEPTRFTPDEQITVMTLWAIFRSPLMFGGDLAELDEFTLSLLTNPEVLAVNQNSTNNRQLFRQDHRIGWVADVPGSSDRYVALFNTLDDNPIDEEKAAWRSDVVTRATPGRRVDVEVPLNGARKLFLVALDADDGIGWDHVDWIEPRLEGPGGERRLTDLDWVRATTGWGEVSTERGAAGQPMAVDGEPVAYGIGTHANSIIEYDLPDGMTHFRAQAGIDDEGGRQDTGATVRFLVFTESPYGGDGAAAVPVSLEDAGFTGICRVRDLWQGKDLDPVRGEFAPVLPPHGAGLYRVSGTRIDPSTRIGRVPDPAYLFSYFIGNGEDGLHLAWSPDGYRFEALKGGQSFLTPRVGESRLMRDPCILRGPDGLYHMVWTTSWTGQTIGYANSKDLIHWSEQRAIPVMAHEPTVRNCWAPEIVYDHDEEHYRIFWASTIPGRFPDTENQAEDQYNHRMYSTTTRDFETFTPTRLFYDPGFNVIDATFLPANDQFYLIIKDETRNPVKKHLRIAAADRMSGPFGPLGEPFTQDWVEGPSAIQIGDETLVYFDAYRDRHYAAMRSTDLETWEDITAQISMPPGARHGTVFEVPREVVVNLMEADAVAEAPVSMHVDLTTRGPDISPTMHGVFFEDINYAADGGIYAELVRNRSFEFTEHMEGWTTLGGRGAGQADVLSDDPVHPNNPHYLRLSARDANRPVGILNTGFGGIAVQSGKNYRFSALVRKGADFNGSLVVRLENNRGGALGGCRIDDWQDDGWTRVSGLIRSAATTERGRLAVRVVGEGSLDLDFVSLFPEDTWQGHEFGMRADLVQWIADMKPGFFRFPGGCIVEGKDLANAYRWKDTIGPPWERKQNWNRWTEWDSPHYYQSYGLGFFEYFQLCDDLNAEPIPILNCGMSCQYQDAELVPLEDLGPWVQDAIDLIEFANGPADSEWGAKRAAMGRAEPFGMKYLGIGNEQWDEQYFDRYEIFYKAIKERYPEIILITTSGPGVDDDRWRLAWNKFKTVPADIVDEHYYRPPDWFLTHADRYDNYDRSGPKVFAGEFAAHGPGRRNTLACALAEAAYMTGLQRNADVVRMAAYAPLLNKIGSSQWRPDLIFFDNTTVFGTPSYYVQQLYALHKGDRVVPITVEDAAAEPPPQGKVGVGTWSTRAEYRNLRVEHNGRTLYESDFSQGMPGWQTSRGDWTAEDGVLRQSSMDTDVRATIGDEAWQDYSFSLQARKLGGNEGFLILFQTRGDEKCWWNLGGWGNTLHGLDVPGIPLQQVDGRIEPNRWYDIRVELEGHTIRCFLDGQLVQQATRTPPRSVFAAASREVASGDLILKFVNTSNQGRTLDLTLNAPGHSFPNAQAIVLTSSSPDDENTLESPTQVAPHKTTISNLGPRFQYTTPPHSFTILRLHPAR